MKRGSTKGSRHALQGSGERYWRALASQLVRTKPPATLWHQLVTVQRLVQILIERKTA